MAVELVMASQVELVTSWAMDGLNEGLAIEFRAPGELPLGFSGDFIDVSSHGDWDRYIGEVIVGVHPAWHIPNEGCPEMPWAFRIDTSKSSFVIALGEVEGVELRYSPDAMVVIFDERLAKSYRVPASSTSSYG